MLFLEEPPADANALAPASPQVAEARISRYTSQEVFVDVNLSDRSWLLLSDAYFPGWKAYIRPFGAGENEEKELKIQRADGALRAVYLPEDGQWTVRFVYSPMSFRLGLYTSFLAMMTILLLLLYWLWGRYYRPEIDANDVHRVTKNSLVPMGLSLTNKAIDFAFAMLYVRLLGPVGTGQYYFVVAIYGFFEIISRYGLGTLLTRDVAADKNQSSRYLTNVVAVRTLLWALCMPLMALVVLGYRLLGRIVPGAESIGPQEIEALILLGMAMLFANYADALSSMFFAFEKMEYPAGLTNAVALIKVSLGALVLLLGWGFVGLAGVSLVVNILQMIWLYLLVRSTLFKPQWKWDWPLQVQMVRMSGPLMINHLLATIFWRIDVWILRPIAGAAAVGLYSVGLKYLDGLNIIPSVSTMAIFPLMSRFARSESNSLLRSYILSLRLLTIVSLPIAMSVTFLARPLVFIVGGVQYLDVPGVFHIFGRTYPLHGRGGPGVPGDHLEHPDRVCQQRHAVRADCGQPAALPDAGVYPGRRVQRRGQPDSDPAAGVCGGGAGDDLERVQPALPVLLQRAAPRGPCAVVAGVRAAAAGDGVDGAGDVWVGDGGRQRVDRSGAGVSRVPGGLAADRRAARRRYGDGAAGAADRAAAEAGGGGVRATQNVPRRRPQQIRAGEVRRWPAPGSKGAVESGLLEADFEHALEVVLGVDLEGDERFGVEDAVDQEHAGGDEVGQGGVVGHAQDGDKVVLAGDGEDLGDAVDLGHLLGDGDDAVALAFDQDDCGYHGWDSLLWLTRMNARAESLYSFVLDYSRCPYCVRASDNRCRRRLILSIAKCLRVTYNCLGCVRIEEG